MTLENRHKPTSRLRFWILLGVWSVVVAVAIVSFDVTNNTDNGILADSTKILAGWTIGVLITAIAVMFISYVLLRIWKNRPTSRKAWFRLGMASVTLGILCGSLQVWLNALDGHMFTLPRLLVQMLIWSLLVFIWQLFLASLWKYLRWLCQWPNLKRFLLASAWLAVLVAAFYAEENWRGKRAWENCKRAWEAKGEKFEMIAFAPPLVPDEQNFAMAPIVVTTYSGRLTERNDDSRENGSQSSSLLSMSLQRTNLQENTNRKIGSWQKATITDLKPWQDYYRTTYITNEAMPYPPPQAGLLTSPQVSSNELEVEITVLTASEFPIAVKPQSPADDVLLALSRYDKTIEELRQAGARPLSRFPLNYQMGDPNEISLPHLTPLKLSVLVLQLRAIAELQAGNTELALADVKLMLRIVNAIRSEPILISHLVRLSLMNLAMQPVWEGLADHRWSDSQLKEIGQALQKQDFISDWQVSLRGERVCGLGQLEHCREHRAYEALYLLFAICPSLAESLDRISPYLSNAPVSLDSMLSLLVWVLPADGLERFVKQLPPDGWYEWNKVTLANIYQNHLLPIADPEKHLINARLANEWDAFWEKGRQPQNVNPQNALAYMEIGAMTTAARRTAVVQNAVDMAILACALERYRLALGDYPEALEQLMPRFIEAIPPDVVDGQPLHYHHTTSNGRFLIYSVGWNGKDDGGVVGQDERGYLKPQLGDWVWQYPAQN